MRRKPLNNWKLKLNSPPKPALVKVCTGAVALNGLAIRFVDSKPTNSKWAFSDGSKANLAIISGWSDEAEITLLPLFTWVPRRLAYAAGAVIALPPFPPPTYGSEFSKRSEEHTSELQSLRHL